MPRMVLIPLDENSRKLAKPNEIMVDYDGSQHISTRIGDKTYSKTRDLEYRITNKIENDRALNNSITDSGIIYSEPVICDLDKLRFTIPKFILNVNGYIVEFPSETITIEEGVASQSYDNEGRYADLVYIDLYKTKETSSEILPNGLEKETRWEYINYQIRVVNHIDFKENYEGITDLQVKPLNISGNLLSNYQSYRNLPNQEDKGCYIIEDEEITSVDHKLYSIPLFKIKRRNSGTFSLSALSNGIASDFYIKGGTDGTFLYSGQVITVDKDSSVNYEVNKTYIHYKNSNKKFKVNRITSTTMTIENISDESSWYILATDKFIEDSTRPDNKSSTIIYESDIIDLRHFISYNGYNYEQLLKDNFNKLIQGNLNQFNFKTIGYETTTQTNSTQLFRTLSNNDTVSYKNVFKNNINNKVYIAKDNFKNATKNSSTSLSYITYLDNYVTLNENLTNLTEKECSQDIYDNLQSGNETFIKIQNSNLKKMTQYNLVFPIVDILDSIYNSENTRNINWIQQNISLKFSSYFTLQNSKMYITLYNFETSKYEQPFLNVIQSSGNLNLNIEVIESKFLSDDNSIIIGLFSDNVENKDNSFIEATMEHAELLFELKSFKFGNIAIPANINYINYINSGSTVDLLLYDDSPSNEKNIGYFSNANLSIDLFYEKNLYQGLSNAKFKKFISNSLIFENDKVLTNYNGFISTIPNTNTLYINANNTNYPYYNYKNINEILPLGSNKLNQTIDMIKMDNSLLISVHELIPVALGDKLFPNTNLLNGELYKNSNEALRGIPYTSIFNTDNSQFGLLNKLYIPNSDVKNRLNISTALVHNKMTNEILLLVITNLTNNNTFISNDENDTYLDLFALDGRPLLKITRKD